MVGNPRSLAGLVISLTGFVFYTVQAQSAVVLLAPVGEAPINEFGWSVSDAGDVNGDGFGDVIVGARWNDAGGMNAGRAYVFFGGPAADDVADWVLTGEEPGDIFGTSVSAAGDVNGDGFGDVIVGAYLADVIWADTGKAYVFYGGMTPDSVPDLVTVGETWIHPQSFGESVSGAGDVNGDGYDDFIVGARGWNSDRGRSYVFFGGASPDTIADVILSGEVVYDSFGFSVSGAGDVNGDNYDDVIVGARGNDTGGAGTGRAYVFYGGPSMDAVPDWVLTGQAAQGLGVSVSGAGDVNGDTYDDVIIGAGSVGLANVYFGGATPNSLEDMTLTGTGSFGKSVSGAGDMNADGFADVIVGAHFNNGGGTRAGRAYVYYGAPIPNAGVDLMMTGEFVDDQMGISVSGAGDVNGDGLADAVVGAFLNDSGGSGAGRAYVFTQGIATAVDPDPPRPTILTAWPLPYRGGPLTITFENMGTSGDPTTLELFDTSGRLLWTHRKNLPPGRHQVSWNGRDTRGRVMRNGIYFLRSTSGIRTATIKITVVH